MANFDFIAQIVRSTQSAPEDKESLLSALKRRPDSELSEIATLLQVDPSLAKHLVENYRAKQATVALGKKDLWKKVIDVEETELQALQKEEVSGS